MTKQKKVISILETGTVHFSFMEVFTDPDTGKQHFTTPHSDPRVYEDSFDYIFDTAKEACEFLKEQVEEESVGVEEAEAWVLVKVQSTAVAKQ